MEQEQRTEGHAPDACPVAGLGLPLATAARLEIGAVTWWATAARVTPSSWHARRRRWSCGCCAGCWRADSWTATTGIALLAPTCLPLSPPPTPSRDGVGPECPAGLCSEREKCCRRLGRATIEKERGPSARGCLSAPTPGLLAPRCVSPLHLCVSFYPPSSLRDRLRQTEETAQIRNCSSVFSSVSTQWRFGKGPRRRGER